MCNKTTLVKLDGLDVEGPTRVSSSTIQSLNTVSASAFRLKGKQKKNQGFKAHPT